MLALFHALVFVHIATGSVGLASFWAPVLTRKGAPAHRRFGRVFNYAILATAASATAMSLLTLAAPMATHPHLLAHPVLHDPELVRGIFGWMMLYLAVLTVNLCWYGWLCLSSRRDHGRNREWRNLALQAAVAVLAANCAWQGFVIGQPLMMGISIVGFATVGTNLFFIYKPRPGPMDWLKEHVKALVGAGISIYIAFFAFGAVRLMPELALNPVLWSAPLVTGLGLILHHWAAIDRKVQAPAQPFLPQARKG